MDLYYLTEETRVGTVATRPIMIPTIIVGYGKRDSDEFMEFLMHAEWSPLSDVCMKSFRDNRSYNKYLKKMRHLGVDIRYDNQLKNKVQTIKL